MIGTAVFVQVPSYHQMRWFPGIWHMMITKTLLESYSHLSLKSRTTNKILVHFPWFFGWPQRIAIFRVIACDWWNVAGTKINQNFKFYKLYRISPESENMTVNVVQIPWNYSEARFWRMSFNDEILIFQFDFLRWFRISGPFSFQTEI